MAQQEKDALTLLLGLGWDRARIAAAYGPDDPETVEGARDRLLAELAIKLWEMAMAGSVSALREFRLLLVAPAEPEEPRPHKRPMGKKEKALIDARAPDMGTPMGELMARRRELSN